MEMKRDLMKIEGFHSICVVNINVFWVWFPKCADTKKQMVSRFAICVLGMHVFPMKLRRYLMKIEELYSICIVNINVSWVWFPKCANTEKTNGFRVLQSAS